jgi:hypothetical protein
MHRAIENDVTKAADHAAGARRRAVALQVGVHENWVLRTLKPWPDEFGRLQLHGIMTEICDGEVPESAVNLVLVLAEASHGQTSFIKSDMVRPLAMWRSLHEEMEFIDRQFARYDADASGKLDEKQLRSLLRDINSGHPPSQEEVDWILSWGDAEGKGIDQGQLHAAIAIWFHHVSPLKIKAKVGCAKMVPFIYCLIASIASSAVVAATTVLFSEEKTAEWLTAVGMSLVWRNFVIDPLKAVMFGRSFEFIFGLIFGGCALEDAAMGVMQDEIEGSTEAVAEGAADVMDDMAGEMDDMAGAGAEDMGGGELTAGAGNREDEEGEEEIDL